MKQKTGPLDGIKVVELSSWVAVAASAVILSDWGASVIKIESPYGGDSLRGYRQIDDRVIAEDDIRFFFEAVNRGKRSVSLGLNKEPGRAVLHKLIEDTDVFMTNVPPQSLVRLGAEYESLIKVNPRLIYLSFTGFGEAGADMDKLGFDITAFWARGGFMYKCAPPSAVPPTQPFGIGDQTSSGFITSAVIAALFARERTGRGQKVSLNLYHIAAWVMNQEIQVVLSTGREARWRYREKAPNPLWNIYLTKDNRWIQLACLQSDRFWPQVCEAIGQQELKQDARFNSHQKREENSLALVSIISKAFSEKTLAEWKQILREYDIIYEIAQTIEEMVKDPQAVQNDFYAEVKRHSGENITLVNSPAKFSETPSSIKFAAPEFNQHIEEVLLELGYDWEDIIKFKEQEVIP